jgi:glyoxylase-like metal-dependent hydrolase (beta-lactamase superfamily II)
VQNPYLNRIGERIFWSAPDEKTDRSVMAAVMGRRCTLIVEAGASSAHAAQFRAALDEIGGAPTRFVALTHWHWDHVLGIAELKLPTIAQRETRQRIQAMAQLDWRDGALDGRVERGEELAFIAEHIKIELTNEQRKRLVIALPDILFDDNLEIDLGGLTAQLIHVGGDHSSDSTVVFIPEERVVFLGDCFYCGFIGDDLFYTNGRLFPLLEQLLALPADTFVLAHNPTPLTRSEFLQEAEQLKAAGNALKLAENDFDAALALLPEPHTEDQLLNLKYFLRGLKSDVSPE